MIVAACMIAATCMIVAACVIAAVCVIAAACVIAELFCCCSHRCLFAAYVMHFAAGAEWYCHLANGMVS